MNSYVGRCLVLAVACLVCGCSTRSPAPPPPAPEPTPLPETASARFEATVFQTRLSDEKAAGLSAHALVAKAATAEQLEAALGEMGKTQALYAVDQRVRLKEDRIKVQRRAPFVTNARVTESGRIVRTVQYENIGADVAVSAQTAAGDLLDLDLTIDLSAMSKSAVEIAEGVQAVALHKVVLVHKGPVEPGKPFVLVGVDLGDDDPDAIAFVCRAILTNVQP